jgi:hypothetical protein
MEQTAVRVVVQQQLTLLPLHMVLQIQQQLPLKEIVADYPHLMHHLTLVVAVEDLPTLALMAVINGAMVAVAQLQVSLDHLSIMLVAVVEVEI